MSRKKVRKVIHVYCVVNAAKTKTCGQP